MGNFPRDPARSPTGLSEATSMLPEALAASEAAAALVRATADAMLDPQILLEAVRDPDGRLVDLVIRSANRVASTYVGGSEENYLNRSVAVTLPNLKVSGLTGRIAQCLEDGKPVIIDNLAHFSDVLLETRHFDIRATQAGVDLIAFTWRDVTERFQYVERIAASERKYRRSIDNAAVGMCLLAPEGRFEEVNEALCRFLGYDAETLKQKTWQELTPPGYLDGDFQNVTALLEGRVDSYRRTKQYIHADGHLVWGDLSVGCLRNADGRVEHIISSISDITALVEANERNRILAQQLQRQALRLTAELESAASYMSSIMPKGLTGEVSVSSRYLPSRELGGDSFDYIWLDADHLLVYLIDVSGHGLAPALLSVSVHNMLRSRSMSTETLLTPEAVLTELNHRFQMDQHDDHYFTMWFGVYQASSRTLRYASAGAPPALAFNSATGTDVVVTELPTTSAPIGMFEDTEFTSRTYAVPPGGRVLVYSDGASEITLADGRQLTGAGFKDLTSRVAASPDWTLDELIHELNALTPSGAFEDDCSLIQLKFPQLAVQKFSEAIPGDTGHSGPQVEIGSQPDPLEAIQIELGGLWLIHPQVPDGVRMQMTIATAEVGANILEHTGRGQLLRIWMNAAVVDDQVHVAFTDTGPPADIDLASVAMPDATAERGRGLAMAQSLLDQLAYRYDASGNHWTLISKRFA